MSRKNQLPPFKVITNGSMTGTSVLTSAAINVQFLDNIAFQAIFSGTPTGTFTVEASLDYSQNTVGGNGVVNAGNWTALTLSPSPVASGAAGSVIINLNQVPYPWIRLKYTNTSGTGTLNALVSGKMI